MIKKIIGFFKKELMLGVALLAAIISLFITKPSIETITSIDYKTLATLFMLLSVLDGFKSENLFLPIINLTKKIKHQVLLSLFLVFGVFFTSMFVTNDVSLIIFVPLTILLFRRGNKEHYILPVIVLENIAAVRGSLLTPFGSPQNLFLFSNSGISTIEFIKMMLPLWMMSIVLLVMFILFIHRKNIKEVTVISDDNENFDPKRRVKRIVYLFLFVVILVTIVTRTTYWPYVTLFVVIMLLIFDRKVFLRVDYVLLLTFFCFFVFSNQISSNPTIANFLSKHVTGNEYYYSIAISQVISNVPGAIVLWPFTEQVANYAGLRRLIYGLDSAGLVWIIGSLASVINLRIYAKSYPGNTKKFIIEFEKISLIFFAIVFVLQILLLKVLG